ncbi:PRD domain-containing protein [Lactobacillus delbrueckii]|uniref:PRD domain-containing protein n=1 Tax=Lactobacillus delbrueckii TaxID=1584 RepID=UPI00358DD2A0
MVHVESMYLRFLNGIPARNLSTLNIRIEYPILFDMSVYFCSILSDRLNITISEDETSFIALHFGSFIEQKSSADCKIKLNTVPIQ